MDINKFSIYYAVSANGSKNEDELGKVLEQIGKLDSIGSPEVAMDFVKTTWKLNENVNRLPIGGECVLTTKDSDDGFSVVFEYANKNVSYYYQK